MFLIERWYFIIITIQKAVYNCIVLYRVCLCQCCRLKLISYNLQAKSNNAMQVLFDCVNYDDKNKHKLSLSSLQREESAVLVGCNLGRHTILANKCRLVQFKTCRFIFNL